MSTDYDGYASRWRERKTQGVNHAHRFLEKPAMRALIPDLQGKRVLALGCGTGEECDFLLEAGASSILGIDLYENMLELARKNFQNDNRVSFAKMDLGELDLPDRSFDYIYSSLAMHYVRDWKTVLEKLNKACSLNTKFLFSTHHPVTWGTSINRTDTDDTKLMGFKRPKDSSVPAEIFGDYMSVREIHDQWFGALDVKYFHKPLSEMFREITAGGWCVTRLIEPLPLDEAQAVDSNFFSITSKIPPFVIIELILSSPQAAG